MLSSLEQILLLMLALNKPELRIDTMRRHMAWFMLPDGIEEYIPNRQISHFETSPDGDVSWMRYPGEISLREMTGDVAELVVDHQLAGPNPAPVLPGPISLEDFDRLNYGHRWFRTIRAHLLQDQACQEVLSKLVDTSKRDEDRYKVYGGLISGRDLEEQLNLLHRLGILRLAGQLYGSSGIEFDDHRFITFKNVWPEELVGRFRPRITLDADLQKRIHDMDWAPTAKERLDYVLSPDLERTLDEIYSKAFIAASMDLFPDTCIHRYCDCYHTPQ